MSDNLHSPQSAAEQWRRRYEVEAQQRRKEYAIAQGTIKKLRAEVQQLCRLKPNAAASLPPSRSTASLQALEAERDQLAQALAQEQEAHARTRDNLISALSDAMGSRPSSASALPPAPH
ncbi:MAG: hypothetical protein WA902_11160 [Thermosynechococcaceae cyanobacterium]